MKYCSVQRGLIFQIKAMLVTGNSTLPDCLQIVDLNLFSVCFQDKTDTSQSKLFFNSLAKIVYHLK